MKEANDETFVECIDALRDPIANLCKDYPLPIVESALIEVGMRMSLISSGNYNTMKLFATIVHNVATLGQMIEKDIQAAHNEGRQVSPFDDWNYNRNITPKKNDTIH